MAYKVIKSKSLIKSVLEDHPECRDCDNKLIARIWMFEMRTNSDLQNSILTSLYYSKLMSPTTIIRTRRIVQNENENLRGKKYKQRTTTLESEARLDIRKNNYGY